MGSTMNDYPDRSFEKIDKADLAHLSDLATECLTDMLYRSKTGQFYSSTDVLMSCLCQGAAQHFVHTDCGVKDWDVVFFFRTNSLYRFPWRWMGNRDFGPSRFGADPDEGQRYSGRRIDVMGRDIPVSHQDGGGQAVVAYLQRNEGSESSAGFWARRPLIALTPGDMRGRVIWEGKA